MAHRLLAAFAATSALAGPSVPDVVAFESGSVLGARFPDDNLRQWFAVPFADSTAGENQWRSPQTPRASWSFVMDCTTWGAGCLQSHHNPDVPSNKSADCLNVNVFAPITPAGAPLLPVMVFLNGGAFMEGSNQGPFKIYNGAFIASTHNVVVMSANYRLGAFGYLATGRDDINGTFGLQDQIAALAWVQRNAAVVGGDANAVTVFGESAGAMSIGALLTSPKAAGLFHRAIMESNVAGFNYKNMSEAAIYGGTFCDLLNCSACNPTCLRAQNAQAVMDAWNTATSNVGDFILTNLRHILDGFLETGMVRDGVFLVDEPLSAVEGGDYWGRHIPLLIGTNTNEGETFIYDGVDFPLPPELAPLAYYGIFEDLNVTEVRGG